MSKKNAGTPQDNARYFRSVATVAVTVTRHSGQVVASMDAIPAHAVIRMEGQHWTVRV